MKKFLSVILITTLLFNLLPVNGLQSADIAYANNVSTEKTIKNDILREISNFKTDFTFSYEGDFSKLKTVIQNAIDDIRKNEQYIYENVSKWQMAMKYQGNTGTLSFKFNYLTDKQKEKYVSAEVKKILPKIIPKGATEIDQVKAVHDYIVLNSSYSSKTKNSQYSTYTLLTEKNGVCQAYALLMLKMLEELKLDAKYVKGYSNNERHAWILVEVDGAWYHVDPTWNDPINSKADEVRYKYFMLTDKQIASTHSWEKVEYPVAKSEKFKSFQVASQAYTINNELFFISEKDKKMYQMNLKTLKATAITKEQFQKNKKVFLAKL